MTTTLTCAQCNKEFERSARQISSAKSHNTKNSFCTKSCAVSHQNKHQVQGQRTSKVERWVQTRVTETFPTLPVDFNKKDTIESELDIYVPSLKLAFELNGITHYKAIFGEDRFLGEQKSDQEKRDKCKALGIELVEVDVSKIKDFKKSVPFMLAVDKVLSTIRDRLKASSL